MIHRHLDYPVDIAPVDLPLAAVMDILDRGDLDDWAPLVEAVVADHRFAEKVAELIDRFPMYGTSPLWRAFLDRHRAASFVTLTELRRHAGLTQTGVAERMRISQSDISKLERRHDVRLSTLRAYIRAIGGVLRLEVAIGSGRYLLRK